MKRRNSGGANLPPDITSTYLADAMAIQSEMLRRLSRGGLISMGEMASLMEDIGNRYLDIAEAIRLKILNDRRGEAGPPQSIRGASNAEPRRAGKRRG